MDDKEAELKAREIALAERELTIRERETEAKIRIEQRGLMFSSPLLIAIVSTVFGTAIGAGLQGYSDARLEKLKFEFSLVQGAFEIPAREEAAKQLRFIADSGVIENMDTDQLRSLADTPEEIPVGFSDIMKLSEEQSRRRLLENEQLQVAAAERQANSTQTGKTRSDGTVKSEPVQTSENLYPIRKGEAVTVLSAYLDDGFRNWYRITSNEGELSGWVEAATIELDDPSAVVRQDTLPRAFE